MNNYICGVVITPDHGNKIINYPEQHIANGRKKNNDTKQVSSFGLESLLWNLPDDVFMRYSIYRYEFGEIVDYPYKHMEEFSSYKEANGIKKLCSTTSELINYKKFIERLYKFYEYDITEEI